MKKLLIALLATLACSLSASAQTTYQPYGSRVVYGDGSTDFYYRVLNPSTNEVEGVTVFFNCKTQQATVIGNYQTVNIGMNCLTPPNGGYIVVTGGGSVNFNGMTVTVNPSTWTVAHGRAGEFVENGYNVPLTVQ